MLATRKRLTGAFALAVVASGLSLLPLAPASANPAGTGLVISEVYGAGGNSGAAYNNDFIELYNPTNADVSVSGWAVQYFSAAGGSGGTVNLTGSVPAQHHYLIQLAAGATVTNKPLPAPGDVTGSINMGSGRVFLLNSTTALSSGGTGAVTPGSGAYPTVVDMVGAASNAASYEGSGPATTVANAGFSVQRVSPGFADSDNNASDFVSNLAPTPVNSSNNATPLALAAVTAKTGSVGKAITGFSLAASGGATPYTYSATGLPDGVSVDPSTGAVSGTPTAACTCAVVAKVTDNAGTEKTQEFTFTVTAFAVTNPGSKSYVKDEAITPFTIAVAGGTAPYDFEVTSGALPTGLSLDPVTGEVSGTPTVSQAATDVTVTVTDADEESATTTFSIAVNAILPIAEIQGTGARSTYAPATGTAQGTQVTTQGVITALYNVGFAADGTKTCGFCGFYMQTPGTPDTEGASDAVFVYGFSGFTGAGLAVGDSVRVNGKVSEFSGSGDTASLTEVNLIGAVTPIADLGDVTPLTAVPAYDDREAHEGELFAPTDLVITDTYNFENYGELGLATGGKPLVQPMEQCEADETTCITDAQQDIKDRGIFFEDGTGTGFLSGSSFYKPSLSKNSDIPLPFIDKTHSARVGASLTFPAGKGGVLDYRNKKWYLQPQRAVSASGHQLPGDDAPVIAPDLGTDVVTIEDTRPQNEEPADVGGNLKIATYNVENYFSITGQAFAAANPYYSCEWDYDRADNPTLTYQCTSPQAIPDQWDSVTGAPTHYKSGVVSAPRGAARQVDLDRQTSKIVNAINGLGADVVSLEELANPNKLRTGVTNGPLNPDTSKADSGLGTPIAWRDESINYLVDHLNAAAGDGTWAFVASPEESTDATSVAGLCSKVQPNGQPVDGPAATAGTCSWASGQDVIRSGFLYKKATVVPVGPSDLDLAGSSAPVPSPFDNAREPLAQFFKPVGHPNSDGFAVIVNHFKSKGDSDPSATGDNANNDLNGAFNGDRTRQAKELLRFANEFAAKWDTDKVFLVGDFNAYTGEQPVQTILDDPDGVDDLDFGLVTSEDEDDLTYVFTATVGGIGYGAAGSLDHVFASAGARADIAGSDVWEINSNEPGVYNYSRFNTNATNFWDGSVPFGGSDHNPEIIGINVDGSASVKDIQIIGSNDFHGRLLGSSSDGGAAQLAGAVKSLKATYGPDNSVFVAAGDLIGASTFESFVQKDKPTLEALNAAGLEVSAVGNHEFDQGYDDLLNRVMKPYNADTNPYGAEGGLDWQYIGANVVWDHDPDGDGPVASGDPIVMPTWTKDFGDGIKISFVGAVTEDLMSLVNPAKMQGVEVDPIAEAVNGYATSLKASGSDLVVLLLHEGAPSTDCDTMDEGDSAFSTLLGDINPDIDAVVSGHTHLEYACSFPVPEWDSKPITARPVVSAGQYGVALDQLVYSFDTTTGEPVDVVSNNVGVKGPGSTLFSYPEDPAVKAIVDQAVADAAGPGAQVLGQIDGPFRRARLADTTTENRGGESTLGNLVAEIQRWATPETTGIDGAQIAFMNPGGLRDDLNGTGDTFPKDVSYKAAAAVQPFANTLVNVDLTGAQIQEVLEQQWQRDAQGNVPSRPFLRLGTSKGFTYTYDETNDPEHAGAKLGHVTGMWLDGVAIDPETSYSVTMNSFLASGGDNFRAFTEGVDKRDTGITDLQAQVDYMAANASEAPLDVDYAQHAVEVTFPNDAPDVYGAGDTVAFDVASWAMTAVGDIQDDQIQVKLGDQVLGTFDVDNAAGSQPTDDAGTASVSVTLPETGLQDGKNRLMLVGTDTGSRVPVAINADDGVTDIQVLATNDFHGRIQRSPSSAEAGAAVLSGAVKELRGENPNTVFAAAGDLIGASTFESFIQNDKPTIDALNEAGLEVSAVGNHELDQGYDDLINRVMAEESEDNPDGGAGWQYIAANLKIKATGDPAVPATWIKTMDGVKVGFVGAVTQDLPSLVSPAGIEDLRVDPIVSSVNAEADDLKDQGADIVVMLVHEGAATTTCADMTDGSTTWGKIVNGVDSNVDAIVSGHTHLAYNCSFPVAAWSDRAVTERPVVSAGQYGYNLNQLDFSVDDATGEVVGVQQNLIPLQTCTNCPTSATQVWSPNFGADPAVTSIVNDAVSQANVLGAQELGELQKPFSRAKLANGTTENRGGESTLGNLVAEVQRWATRNPESGSAQIAFMNPGGLRDDMVGTVVDQAYLDAHPDSELEIGDRALTYKQAAVVQPFANTLVNMDLTGAQIETVLEQQWQRDGSGNVPARPFLRLGTSDGFTYTYEQHDDPAKPGQKLGEVTGMWLDGVAIDPAATYSVTVNSFLASGGDNFRELANGTGKQDTGKADLQAMVDYMAAADGAVAPDYAQHAVGVTFPAEAPASYQPGDEVTFALSSLAMSATADTKDPNVTIWLDGQPVRTVAVDNTIGTDVYDEYGTAQVTFTLPPGTPAGTQTVHVRGGQTGTDVPVEIAVETDSAVSAGANQSITWGDAASIPVTVTGNDGVATGTVRLFEGGTQIGEATSLVDGAATLPVAAKSLEPGAHTLSVEYDGNYPSGSDEVVLTVTKAPSTVDVDDVTLAYGDTKQVTVTLGDATATGTVEIQDGGAVLDTAVVTGGVATLTLPAKSLEPGEHGLTAQYSGDDHFEANASDFSATVTKATSTANAGNVSLTYGKAATVTVHVGPAGATGTVRVLEGSKVLGTATVSGGVAKVTLPARSLDPGSHNLTATYVGDTHFNGDSDTFTATVAKAASTTKVTASPATAKVRKTVVTLRITVSGPAGVAETGKARVTIPGQGTKTVTLKAGKATLKLAKFTSTGKKTVRVSYLGSEFLKPSSDTVRITVKK